MIGKLIQKIFGTASERHIKKLMPLLEEINEIFEGLSSLTDEELSAKTVEFKAYINKKAADVRSEIEEIEGMMEESEDPQEHARMAERLEELRDEEYALEQEALDDIMTEAFAVVKETCRRLVGKEFVLTGSRTTWNMIPYDVQLLGAIVLHRGMISEMKTGEGKTLVSSMPLYLNALVGKGSHLVTVNDYLARRDAEWNSPIYNFLGLKAGVVSDKVEPHSPERKGEYDLDITYGTNNHFGFDYLRDNMSQRAAGRVQRGFYYCIIDEVDSVLIDEARTPLIISGPVESKINARYSQWVGHVENLVRKQINLSTRLLKEAQDHLDNEEEDKAATKLLMVQRSTPKNARFLKMVKQPGIQKLINQMEANFLRDKNMHELDAQLFFAKEERESSINLQDKGMIELSPSNPELFVLPDLQYEIDKIEMNPDLSDDEKKKGVKQLYDTYTERSEITHAINQLLKAYTLFEKDVDYVVHEGKVVIVDQFTGRLMPGRRFSDGLHQALEARERVKVEQETQTFATITIQNFFRLYRKLSGMTGTAATEAQEFYEIYKLEVISIPTNKPVIREDNEDIVYMTRREKYNAILDEIEARHKEGRPILVGTVSVEVSETLSRMLKRRGISHSVLNAKHHEKEAEIVARAGRQGAVTIATNMAGRGTDIKLGDGVPDLGGLYIIGSERHESRRIDNQLRGRSGRQGDPGSSVFFVSMEDDLMRLHAGGERIASLMEKMGTPKDEPLVHPMVSSSIERAQKRVEMQNFSIRKHLLEYDDVMNQQRTVIYQKRNEILDSTNPVPNFRELVSEEIERLVDETTDPSVPSSEWDWDSLTQTFSRLFLTKPPVDEDTKKGQIDEVLREAALESFEKKRHFLGDEIARDLLRWAMLGAIDTKWKEHLHSMDTLKEGISLRSYAQKDPLIEYKKEGYETFLSMLSEIARESILRFFHTQVRVSPEQLERSRKLSAKHDRVGSFDKRMLAEKEKQGESTQPVRRQTEEKVGRNDPCPCGSGKKYKHCCGR